MNNSTCVYFCLLVGEGAAKTIEDYRIALEAKRIFAFTRAFFWKETVFFVPAFAKVFPGIIDLSCNCFLSWYARDEDTYRMECVETKDRGSRIEDRGSVNRFIYFFLFTKSALKEKNYNSLYFS